MFTIKKPVFAFGNSLFGLLIGQNSRFFQIWYRGNDIFVLIEDRNIADETIKIFTHEDLFKTKFVRRGNKFRFFT